MSGEIEFFSFDSSYTTTRAKIKTDDIRSRTLKIDKTKLSEAINELKLNYAFNSAGSTAQIERANSTDETAVNATIEKIFDADFIVSTTSAGALADHYCQDASTAFWGMPRNLIEFETADMRGANAGWDGADFEPIYSLELFDIIEFNHTEWDSVKKCNGESWNGKQFLIYEITRGLTTIKVKGLEL